MAFNICHLADVHLGFRRYGRIASSGLNQREADVNGVFREAIDRVVAIKPKLTIIAGDLFHSVRPSNITLSFAFREIRRLAEQTGAPVVIVAGNHETPRRNDQGSPVDILAEIKNVYVATREATAFNFEKLSLRVTCLPHAALIADNKPRVRADDRFKYNVLVAHGQASDSYFSDFGGAEINMSELRKNEWDYIALGHVHVYISLGLNAAYSGSLEHTSANIWSEATFNKGFVEFQLPDGKKIFHEMTSPRQLAAPLPVSCKGLEPAEVDAAIVAALKQIAGGIDGKIVRIRLTEISRETYRFLNHKALREARAAALHLSIEAEFTENRELTTWRVKSGNLFEQLTQYYKERPRDGLTQDEFVELSQPFWNATNDEA